MTTDQTIMDTTTMEVWNENQALETFLRHKCLLNSHDTKQNIED